MSKRNDLSALFREYKQQYDALQAAIKEVRKSTLLTDEGKKQEIQRLTDNFKPLVAKYHDAAASILDESIQSLSAQWSQASMSKLTDGNYQAGLSNVLKMIESGSITRKEDMQAIIDTYKGDHVAMSTIRNLLVNNMEQGVEHRYNSFNAEKAAELSNMLPRDNRDHNMKLLQQLRGNVDKYINENALSGAATKSWNGFNTVDPSMSMSGMSEFVDSRLNDNFELTGGEE